MTAVVFDSGKENLSVLCSPTIANCSEILFTADFFLPFYLLYFVFEGGR